MSFILVIPTLCRSSSACHIVAADHMSWQLVCGRRVSPRCSRRAGGTRRGCSRGLLVRPSLLCSALKKPAKKAHLFIGIYSSTVPPLLLLHACWKIAIYKPICRVFFFFFSHMVCCTLFKHAPRRSPVGGDGDLIGITRTVMDSVQCVCLCVFTRDDTACLLLSFVTLR